MYFNFDMKFEMLKPNLVVDSKHCQWSEILEFKLQCTASFFPPYTILIQNLPAWNCKCAAGRYDACILLWSIDEVNQGFKMFWNSFSDWKRRQLWQASFFGLDCRILYPATYLHLSTSHWIPLISKCLVLKAFRDIQISSHVF